MSGKFRWNGTGIRRNDQNPAGICGASLRPHGQGQRGGGQRVVDREEGRDRGWWTERRGGGQGVVDREEGGRDRGGGQIGVGEGQ